MDSSLEWRESCLLRLDVIAVKCDTLLWMFRRCLEDNDGGRRARALLFENMILQANNFNKVRKEMCGDIRFGKIDCTARPLVRMAVCHERSIRRVRNEYVAHVQEGKRFEKTLEDILDEQKTPSRFADWIMLMLNIRKYGFVMAANFEEEFEAAGIKYDAQSSESTRSGISINDVEGESRRIFAAVQKELIRKGFKTRVSDGLIQRMKDG